MEVENEVNFLHASEVVVQTFDKKLYKFEVRKFRIVKVNAHGDK